MSDRSAVTAISAGIPHGTHKPSWHPQLWEANTTLWSKGLPFGNGTSITFVPERRFLPVKRYESEHPGAYNAALPAVEGGATARRRAVRLGP